MDRLKPNKYIPIHNVVRSVSRDQKVAADTKDTVGVRPAWRARRQDI